jgi:hypothetical protein
MNIQEIIPPLQLEELLNKLTMLRKRIQKDINKWGSIEKIGKEPPSPTQQYK